MKEMGAEYTDVTKRFIECVGTLGVGEMVHSDSFKIEDAMSSIELMEPKMDPGFANREKLAARDKMRHEVTTHGFEPNQVCRIADRLIGQLYLWLEGHIYIQTVHASMFMIHRNDLQNQELTSFCETLLSFCSSLRTFMTPTGVCDEEDYVGYMFGFDKECGRSKTPQLMDHDLSIRFQFIENLGKLLTISCDPIPAIQHLVEKLFTICSNLENCAPLPDSATSRIIETCTDPHYHRSLLPPGPPRIVPSVGTSNEIYAKWSQIFKSLLNTIKSVDHDSILSAPYMSPFVLFNRLRTLRHSTTAQNSFVRAFTFHRVYYSVNFPQLLSNWIGERTLQFFRKYLDKQELDNFMNDFATVLGRAVHTMHRSTSRQQRALKHVLADLSILQQVAWDIHTRVSLKKIPSESAGLSKCLWSLVVVVGCTLIQDNLLLNLKLDLVDLATEESALIFFLAETVTSVKLFVLNDLLSQRMVSLNFLGDLRNETMITAIEHSAAQALFDVLKPRTSAIDADNLARMFELRTAPIRAFILPKAVSVEDFVNTEKFGSTQFQSLDECLGWIDRATKQMDNIGRLDGSLILGNLTGVKKALLTTKMTLLKCQETDIRLDAVKVHPLVPHLVSR